MPAGKAGVTGGVAWAKRVHFGVNVRSMRRYAKPRTPALTVAELREHRRALRFTFKIYSIDCANQAPTATERRNALTKIKTPARRLADERSWSSADTLLTTLDTADLDARRLVYRQLTKKGLDPLQFKKTLRNWHILSSFPEDCLPVVDELANLDVEDLVPAAGRFPDPGLAKAVAALVPIWKRVTGRAARPTSVGTAALRSAGMERDQKKHPFADWLSEMHALLEVAQPPVGRIVDIVRAVEARKNPAPVSREKNADK